MDSYEKKLREDIHHWLAVKVDAQRTLLLADGLVTFLGSQLSAYKGTVKRTRKTKSISDSVAGTRGKVLVEILKTIEEPIDGFDPNEIAGIVSERDPVTFPGFTPKQANGLLRHLALAGLVFIVSLGKRGKNGKMPRYKLANIVPSVE